MVQPFWLIWLILIYLQLLKQHVFTKTTKLGNTVIKFDFKMIFSPLW